MSQKTSIVLGLALLALFPITPLAQNYQGDSEELEGLMKSYGKNCDALAYYGPTDKVLILTIKLSASRYSATQNGETLVSCGSEVITALNDNIVCWKSFDPKGRLDRWFFDPPYNRNAAFRAEALARIAKVMKEVTPVVLATTDDPFFFEDRELRQLGILCDIVDSNDYDWGSPWPLTGCALPRPGPIPSCRAPPRVPGGGQHPREGGRCNGAGGPGT